MPPVLDRTVATDCPRGSVVLQMLPALLWQAAHDLNNHLTTVLGKAEIALMSADPARWRRGLEDISEAGQQARLLVADLQRVAVWQQGAEPVPLADVLAIVPRLAARALRRTASVLAADGSGANILVPRPADIAVALWLAVREALAEAEQHGPRSWRLSSLRCRDTFAVVLSPDGDAPSAPFGPETRAAIEHAARTGESVSGPLGLVLQVLAESGGRLTFDGNSARFEFGPF